MTISRPRLFSLKSGCLFLAFILATPTLEANDAQAFARKLQPLVDQHTMAGAVILVANKDRVLNFEAVGYADLKAHKPMRKESIFWIASMSKPMTRAAIMMLADEGKVNLDDPAEKYLPEFKGQQVSGSDGTLRAPSHPFTIKEAMWHMAGLPFKSKKEDTLKQLDLLPLKDSVRTYAEEPLRNDPGTKKEYSNEGLNITSRIIEVVSGMPYDQFMSERLFKPLGMKDTMFWPEGEQLDRIAQSYQTNTEKNGLIEIPVGQLTYPLNDRAKRYAFGAGGLFSTAEDVNKFAQMILHGGMVGGKRILSAKAAEENFSHGGAYKTEFRVNQNLGYVAIFLVQQGSSWPADGDKVIPALVWQTADEIGKNSSVVKTAAGK